MIYSPCPPAYTHSGPTTFPKPHPVIRGLYISFKNHTLSQSRADYIRGLLSGVWRFEGSHACTLFQPAGNKRYIRDAYEIYDAFILTITLIKWMINP